jgi:hypothetical protein
MFALYYENPEKKICLEVFNSYRELKKRGSIPYGVKHLIVKTENTNRVLVYNGIEIMAVDSLSDGRVSNKYFNGDFLSKKARKISKEDLASSVNEIEASLKNAIHDSFLQKRILH